MELMADAALAEMGQEIAGLSGGRNLVNGQFVRGHAGGPGRPRGSRNFERVLTDAAPKLAKAYVSRALKGSAPLLIDSRKVFLPIEEDGSIPPSVQTVILVGDSSMNCLPRPPETLTLTPPPG